MRPSFHVQTLVLRGIPLTPSPRSTWRSSLPCPGSAVFPAPEPTSVACWPRSLASRKPPDPPLRRRTVTVTTLSRLLRLARRSLQVASARLVSLTPQFSFHARRLTIVIDTAATDDAEDESPSKKKVSPTKRKGKAAADAADPDEEVLVKSEAE
jgi:hypothetical protein